MNRIVIALLATTALFGCGQRRSPQTVIPNGNAIGNSLQCDQQEATVPGNRYRCDEDETGSGWTLGDVSGHEYLRVFRSHIESYGIESVSFYDITGDGIPEVWLFTNRCEAEKRVLVYSIQEWKHELFWCAAGHSGFYKGNGYVLRLWAHMGDAFWYHIRWNGGKMVMYKVFEEHTVPVYTSPSEESFVEISPEDLDPAELLRPLHSM